MSQYYPQQTPPYPPEQIPEAEYYYDEDDYEYEEEDYPERQGDTLLQRALIFFSGGCLVFLCMSCCALLFAGLWVLDPGKSLLSPTPIPGSDLGLSFNEPAFPNESVVNEQKVRLTILEVNRNASLETVPPVEGRELIIVTIELVNLGDQEISYNERDFMLLNRRQEAYIPTPATGLVEGALGRGRLGPDEGVEGRLIFEVVAGEPELVLAWDGGAEVESRYIYLE